MNRDDAADLGGVNDNEFYSALILWVEAKYGLTPTWIEIAVAENSRTISEPVRRRNHTSPLGTLRRDETPAPPRLTKDQIEARDLIVVRLEDLGCRLSTKQLLAALEKDGKIVSLSFLQHLLPRLVEAGDLSKPDDDQRGDGYGLPAWIG